MGIRPIKLKGIIAFVLITMGVGFIGAMLGGSTKALYASLNKPPLAPPNIFFAIIWPILYALIGIAAYIISIEHSPLVGGTLKLYWVQLVLNALWPLVFWRFGQYTLAAFLIGLIILLVVVFIARAAKINRTAALLFVPYLLWLLFALYLNIGIAVLN